MDGCSKEALAADIEESDRDYLIKKASKRLAAQKKALDKESKKQYYEDSQYED